jgi:hypothetical protein
MFLSYLNERLARFFDQIMKLVLLPEFFFNDLEVNFKKYLITGGIQVKVNTFN